MTPFGENLTKDCLNCKGTGKTSRPITWQDYEELLPKMVNVLMRISVEMNNRILGIYACEKVPCNREAITKSIEQALTNSKGERVE